MKNSVNLEKILAKELKSREFRLAFDKQRFYLQVAHLISQLRQEAGLSQEELARKAKVSQPMIARLEKGDKKRAPTFDTLFKLLKALGYEMGIAVRREKKKAA